MPARLMNVRLDPERIRKARRLRENGVTLSDLVRDAIDTSYERLVGTSKRRDVDAIMREIYEQYPDPPGVPPRRYSVHSGREARNAVRKKLRTETR